MPASSRPEMHLPDEIVVQIFRLVPRKQLARLALSSKQFLRCARSVFYEVYVREGMMFGYNLYPATVPCILLRVIAVYRKKGIKMSEATWVKVQPYTVDHSTNTLTALGRVLRRKACKRPSGKLYLANCVNGSVYRSKFDLCVGYEHLFVPTVNQ